MSRGFTPTTIFSRFKMRDGSKISAAEVHEEDVAPIRRFWKLPDIQVGQWIILKANGGLTVMTDEEFQQHIS